MQRSLRGDRLRSAAGQCIPAGCAQDAYEPDGTIKWSYTTGGDVDSSPGISEDGIVYVGSDDDKVYALAQNGDFLWSYATGGDVHASPAIGPDQTIYVGSHDGNLYALNPDGTLKWSFATADIIRSSAAIAADGTVYVGSHDNRVYAIGGDGPLCESPWPKFRADARNTGHQ